MSDMFSGADSFSFCLPDTFFIEGETYSNIGLNNLVDKCTESSPPVFAKPYFGPISRPLAKTEVIQSGQAAVTGFRMNLVESVFARDQQMQIISSTHTAMVIQLPNNLSGIIDLNLHWKNADKTGIYRIPEALNVIPIKTTKIDSTQKVNAGSFKGYVAVYALGYEGQRLSAKIGNDWVIVDPIVNNESANLARVTDFTGAGVDIAVRIYIDRVLIDTINLTTK